MDVALNIVPIVLLVAEAKKNALGIGGAGSG
jgi:hypothetical protein